MESVRIWKKIPEAFTTPIGKPTNVSERYRLPDGLFYSHKLNGIEVFVLPDSIEARLIMFITSYQHTDFYYQSTEDFKTLSRKFQEWKKSRGFDWD